MLKTNTRTLLKKYNHYKKATQKFEIAQQVISNLPRPRTRSPMNRESSVVTPIRKHNPSKKQYQNRLDKANAKISELEKELSEANLKKCSVGETTKSFKTSRFK